MRSDIRSAGPVALEALDPRVLLAVLPPGVFDNGSAVVSTVAADFDGDGKLDLAISTGNQVTLLRGRGNGTFRPAAVTNLRFAAGELAAGEFDGDAGAELISVGANGTTGFSTVRVLSYDASLGRLVVVAAKRIAGAGFRPVAADLQGDATDEIVLTAGARSTLFVLHDEVIGGSRLRYARRMFQAEGTLVGPAVGDLDGDGRVELVYADSGPERARVVVVVGDGGDPPTFGRIKLEERAGHDFWSVLVGDVDGDGRNDVLFTATSREVFPVTSLLAVLNSESGLADEPTLLHELHQEPASDFLDSTQVLSARIVGLGRIGGDGWREVLIHRIARQPEGFLLRTSAPVFVSRGAGGEFVEVAGFAHGIGNTVGVNPLMIQGDFAGDGAPDLVWTMRANGRIFGNSRVRVIMNSDANQAPTVERPRGPFLPVARGQQLVLGGRPMDAEFLLGRAVEPTISFYLDSNQNGVLDAGDRHMVTRRVEEFRLYPATFVRVVVGLNWEVGTFRVFARANDEQGQTGPAVRLIGGRFMGRVIIT